jgi:polar amino acid transport system permease protein
MEVIWQWFRWLYQETGINFSVFYDPYHRQNFAGGILMTLQLATAVLLASTAVALLCVWLQRLPFPPIHWFVRAYVSLFRNSPKLVQLYFFFFGVSVALPKIDDGTGFMVPMIGAIGWVLIAFTLHYAAFLVEVFRSGIEAVPITMVESASSLGMSRFQLIRHVLFPLAFRICLPALNNNYVFIVKGTSMAYAVGVGEIVYEATHIYGADANVTEMMIVLLICYVSIVSIVVVAMNVLERRLRIPGIGLS